MGAWGFSGLNEELSLMTNFLSVSSNDKIAAELWSHGIRIHVFYKNIEVPTWCRLVHCLLVVVRHSMNSSVFGLFRGSWYLCSYFQALARCVSFNNLHAMGTRSGTETSHGHTIAFL